MKNKTLALLFALALSLGSVTMTGCVSGPSSPPLTSAEAQAWSFANAYETANVATGNALTPESLASALSATVTPTDDSTYAAAVHLAQAAVQAHVNAVKAGASPLGAQASVTAILSDPGVIGRAAALIGKLVHPASASNATIPGDTARCLLVESGFLGDVPSGEIPGFTALYPQSPRFRIAAGLRAVDGQTDPEIILLTWSK